MLSKQKNAFLKNVFCGWTCRENSSHGLVLVRLQRPFAVIPIFLPHLSILSKTVTVFPFPTARAAANNPAAPPPIIIMSLCIITMQSKKFFGHRTIVFINLDKISTSFHPAIEDDKSQERNT